MLRVVPSFEAVGRWLEASNPLLVWSRMMQAAWSPWVHGLTGEAHVEDCASIYGSWAGLSRRGGQGDADRELSSSLRDPRHRDCGRPHPPCDRWERSAAPAATRPPPNPPHLAQNRAPVGQALHRGRARSARLWRLCKAGGRRTPCEL